MRLRTRLAVSLLVALAAVTAADATTDPPPFTVLGPEPVTVIIDVEYSAFHPSSLRVQQGTEVRFVVVNRDPINHELIVGPPGVHDRHRDGTEAAHPPVPGEVSVSALARGVTTYRFDQPGTVEMACHLPGHYDYGMRGQIEVVPLAS